MMPFFVHRWFHNWVTQEHSGDTAQEYGTNFDSIYVSVILVLWSSFFFPFREHQQLYWVLWYLYHDTYWVYTCILMILIYWVYTHDMYTMSKLRPDGYTWQTEYNTYGFPEKNQFQGTSPKGQWVEDHSYWASFLLVRMPPAAYAWDFHWKYPFSTSIKNEFFHLLLNMMECRVEKKLNLL